MLHLNYFMDSLFVDDLELFFSNNNKWVKNLAHAQCVKLDNEKQCVVHRFRSISFAKFNKSYKKNEVIINVRTVVC